MKQIYYTSCKTGRCLSGGNGGFQVRAASPSVSLGERALAERLSDYKLPAPGIPHCAPVKLALCRTDDGKCVIVHAVSAGLDPDTGRSGNYFAHVLIGPDTTSPQSVIEAWGSPEWQTEDGDFSATLSDVDRFPCEGTYLHKSLAEVLGSDRVEHLIWLLGAWLNHGIHSRRVMINDSPDVIVRLLFGIVSVLPMQLTRELTFSTYEHMPLTASARIVGTLQAADWEFPNSYYQGRGGVAAHFALRKFADVGRHAFVEMVRIIGFDSAIRVSRQLDDLESGFTHALFESVCRFESNYELTSTEYWTLLSAPSPISDRAAMSDRHFKLLLDIFAHPETAKWFFEFLVSQPTVLQEKLARGACEMVADAIQDGSVSTLRHLLLSLPDLCPIVGQGALLSAANQHIESASLGPRRLILSVLRRSIDSFGLDRLREWLLVTPDDQLGGLLTTDSQEVILALSDDEKVIALAAENREPRAVVAALIMHEHLLPKVMDEYSGADRCRSDEELSDACYALFRECQRLKWSMCDFSRLSCNPRVRWIQVAGLLSLDKRYSRALLPQLTLDELQTAPKETLELIADGFASDAKEEDLLMHRDLLDCCLNALEANGGRIPERFGALRKADRLLRDMTIDAAGVKKALEYWEITFGHRPVCSRIEGLGAAVISAACKSCYDWSLREFLSELWLAAPDVFGDRPCDRWARIFVPLRLGSTRPPPEALPCFVHELFRCVSRWISQPSQTAVGWELLEWSANFMLSYGIRTDSDLVVFLRVPENLHDRNGKRKELLRTADGMAAAPRGIIQSHLREANPSGIGVLISWLLGGKG